MRFRDNYNSIRSGAPLPATAVAARLFQTTSGALRVSRNQGCRHPPADSSIYTEAVPLPPISPYNPQVAARHWELHRNHTPGSRFLPPNESPPTESDHLVAEGNTRPDMPRRRKKLFYRTSGRLSQPPSRFFSRFGA